MRHRDRAMLLQQQHRQRPANDVRAPNHHRISTGQVAEIILQQHQAPGRRARRQAILANDKFADILDMEAVHILVRTDRVDHLPFVDLPRQRQLNQNAMHRRVAIQSLHQRQQLALGRISRQLVLERVHTRGHGLLALVQDIHRARRILTDQHHRQPRLHTVRREQGTSRLPDAHTQPGRKRPAINNRCHGISVQSAPPRHSCHPRI